MPLPIVRLWALSLFVTLTTASLQSPVNSKGRSGLVTVNAATPIELREWDARINQMVRARQFLTVSSYPDPDIAGRTHETVAQYYQNIPVYGGSLSRQAAQGVSVSTWADPPVVDTHAHAGWMEDYLFKQVNWTGIDNRRGTITMAVHTGLVNNAFFIAPPLTGPVSAPHPPSVRTDRPLASMREWMLPTSSPSASASAAGFSSRAPALKSRASVSQEVKAGGTNAGGGLRLRFEGQSHPRFCREMLANT